MRNKMILSALLTLSTFTTSAWADSKKIVIDVNGMVCAFCAQGIEKKFKSNESVENVNVKLESHLVTVALKEGKELKDDEIKKMLESSGFNVQKITR